MCVHVHCLYTCTYLIQYMHNYFHISRLMYSIFLQSTSVLVCSVHVLALYVCTISIVLWFMLCDGFTYFSQRVGVTSALPVSVPYTLHHYYSWYQASSNEWLYSSNRLLHNKTATDFPHLPSLDDRPSVGFSVGLLIDNTGALHIFFNGTSSERLATGLPINKRICGELWTYMANVPRSNLRC